LNFLKDSNKIQKKKQAYYLRSIFLSLNTDLWCIIHMNNKYCDICNCYWI